LSIDIAIILAQAVRKLLTSLWSSNRRFSMNKVAFALPIAALALLGACATEDKATPAPVVIAPAPAPVVTAPPTVVVQQPSTAVVPASVALRPGHGRIESIAAVPPSAAAGGTAVSRVGLKMDDNTLQFVDTNAAGLQIGDRVEITPEGTIRR
jgi:hypothetical protein